MCALSLPTVTCPPSPSVASRVVNIQTPSVPIVGSTQNFSCSEYEDGMTEQSTCGIDGQWSPDPETFPCPTPRELTSYNNIIYLQDMCHSHIVPPVMCPVPGAPSNGSVNACNTQTYIEGSEVNYQCNEELFPMGLFTTTCTRDRQNIVWKPEDPSTVECRTAPGGIKKIFRLF